MSKSPAVMPIGAPYTTALACSHASVTRGQLRTYERLGLMRPPRRTAAGYRLYSRDDLARLRAIVQLKDLGLTLAEIGQLLTERDCGRLGTQRIRAICGEMVAKLDARIAQLQQLRADLALVLDDAASLAADPDCGFLLDFLLLAQPAAAAQAVRAADRPARPAPAQRAALRRASGPQN